MNLHMKQGNPQPFIFKFEIGNSLILDYSSPLLTQLNNKYKL